LTRIQPSLRLYQAEFRLDADYVREYGHKPDDERHDD
jgi:hypothetical protein